MSRFRSSPSFSLSLVCLLSLIGGALEPIPVFAENERPRVIVIEDGKSWLIEQIVTDFKRELKKLSDERFDPQIEQSGSLGWNRERIAQSVDQALADPEVSAIVTTGSVSSTYARERETRSKPVFSGWPMFSDIAGLPITETGGSSLENFSFIFDSRRIENDLERLKEISRTKEITVVADQMILTLFPHVKELMNRLGKKIGAKLSLLTVQHHAAELKEKLPTNVSAVYVGILPRFNESERRALYAFLAKNKNYNLAMGGHSEVKLGALLGVTKDLAPRIAKRTALNLYQALGGIPIRDLPVALPVSEQLLINGAVLREQKYKIDYLTAISARYFGRPREESSEPLTISQAMSLASKQSPAVLVAQAGSDSAKAQIDVRRSSLLPQFGTEASASYSRAADVDLPTTAGRSEFYSYGFRLRQMLYNDSLISQFRASQRSAEATALEFESARLDVVLQAAIAFLDVLTERARVSVGRRNLELLDSNLQLARTREEIGVASAQEIYRWESAQASGRADIIGRRASLDAAGARLNEILGSHPLVQWEPEDISLGDDEFYFLDSSRFSTEIKLDFFFDMAPYLVDLAAKHSPELAAFDRRIEAQGIVLRERKRSFYVPQLDVESTFGREHGNTNLFGVSDESKFFVGARASWPIFQGGLRRAQVSQNEAELRRLQHRREQGLKFLEQQALSAYAGISGTHPSITLSRQAYQAAERNFVAVQNKYSQGVASVIDLLDAQEALLDAELASKVAVYNYLEQIFLLQRTISWFEFEKNPEEMHAFAEALYSYLGQDPNKARDSLD